ncbi:hypothetical protein [Hyphococcus luteus]|uniref:Uncharacterized protein n=1 Tax=Hyphococcus luteus TaxID=2058213 RepID=A0A2S7K5E5_9PROT|nr:hypothetical protein [Marinicaulis flavus]PQA87734.1 hypothetical protein CW354_05065 [Marinicaulis flavus]
MSERIRKAKRRYTIELFAAMALYVIVLFGALTLAKTLPPGPLLIALALAPVAPILLAAAAFFRFYRNMDEMQRRVTANAAALTLVIGILLAITLGFLRRFGVMNFEDDMMWLGPVLIGIWGGVRYALGGRDC